MLILKSCNSHWPGKVIIATISPIAQELADTPMNPGKPGHSGNHFLTKSGPSRSTNSAPCASNIAGAIESDVDTMQPIIRPKPRSRAVSRIFIASVSPPVLSSLI